jgi:hypothetical protein
MQKSFRYINNTCLLLLFTFGWVYAQSQAKYQKNNTVTLADGWNFGAGTGASFALKSSESTLFRGNSMATKMFGSYNFGTIGLGFNTGIVPGTINNAAINSFLTERKIPADAAINSTKALNAYLLLGPGFNFGHRVNINAGISGGLFYNNAGSMAITQQGAARALYRFDGGSKNVFPGFSGSIHIAYPVNSSTRFFINTDYLQSKSSVRLFDPQRGIDIASEQNRDLKLFTSGVGIVKTFGGGQQSSRVLPTVNKKEISGEQTMGQSSVTSPRDAASGLPTGRILSPRDAASGMPTGRRVLPTVNKRTIEENCGPVTIKTTSPDGTVNEKIFSCPADAASYARQTQGTSFGEKVNQGLHAAGSALAQGASLKNQGIIHRDVAARNIIAGTVNFGSGSSNGIVTNKSTFGTNGSGAASASYASGKIINSISTAVYAREAASGMATGRRQYEPVFADGSDNNCSTCQVKVQNNPLYTGNDNTGTNLLHKNSNACSGISGLKVYLVNITTGVAIASTVTEDCGEFWFANVPDGEYTVKINGGFISKKGYDIYMAAKGSYDVAGQILAADDFWTVEIITAEGTPEEAAAVIKTKTKSNQSNDRIINTSRSNIKNLTVSIADVDEDGVSELWVGNSIGRTQANGAALVGGSLPGGAVISSAMLQPGNPIGGLNIKGGKNPGGNQRTVNTNEFGEFEFTGWQDGNYTITAEMNYIVADETFVAVGKEFAEESNTPASNSQLQKAGINGINSSNMPNRISMNVTVPKQTQGASFGEKLISGNNNSQPVTKAQNNNTVRSNRTDNAIIIADLDGDGEMESSVLNFNGEVATITINPAGTAGKAVEKTTSGLKDVLKTQVRMAAGNGPSVWVAADAALRVHGDPHVDQKDGSLIFEGNNAAPVAKANWKSTEVAVKAITCSNGTCAVITAQPNDFPAKVPAALNGLPPGTPVTKAAVWFADDKGNIYNRETDNNGRISLNGLPQGTALRMLMNLRCVGTDDIMVTFETDEQGNAISNVLKTKHDTAKNAIGNIR